MPYLCFTNTSLLPQCFTNASLMPRRCLTDASPITHWCLTDALPMPHQCLTNTSPMPHRYLTDASIMFLWYLTDASLMLHIYPSSALRKPFDTSAILYWCSTGSIDVLFMLCQCFIALMLHWRFTNISTVYQCANLLCTKISSIVHWCFADALPIIHQCSTNVSPILWWCIAKA